MRVIHQVINAVHVEHVHIIVIAPVVWPRVQNNERIAPVGIPRVSFHHLWMSHVEPVFTPCAFVFFSLSCVFSPPPPRPSPFCPLRPASTLRLASPFRAVPLFW